MKRIIPYVASNFRRDKIWLRRTRPSKRDCRIVLAVDDSSSMADSGAQEVTFRALATLCDAFSVLEVGSLGVVRFGQRADVVVSPKERLTAADGARMLSAFTFAQTTTHYIDLLAAAAGIFDGGSGSSGGHAASRLLVILSDGRGVLAEGEQRMHESVRAARLRGIFMVFVILEAETTGESVLDIRKYDHEGNLKPYMEHFPFPFYIILRDLKQLPQVLADVLRQWFVY